MTLTRLQTLIERCAEASRTYKAAQAAANAAARLSRETYEQWEIARNAISEEVGQMLDDACNREPGA